MADQRTLSQNHELVLVDEDEVINPLDTNLRVSLPIIGGGSGVAVGRRIVCRTSGLGSLEVLSFEGKRVALVEPRASVVLDAGPRHWIQVTGPAKNYFPLLTAEANVTDASYAWGHVRRYGGTGDGVSNDYAAVVATDAAAALFGTKASFSYGTFLNASSPFTPWTPSTGVTWEGEGYNTVFKVATPDALGKHCISIGAGSVGWTVRRLRLEGPQSGDIIALGLSYGLGIVGGDRDSRIDYLGATVEDVWVRNFPNHGFRVDEGACNLNIVRPRAYNCGVGIAIGHGSNDITVIAPELEHIWAQAFLVDDATSGDTPATAVACERIEVIGLRARDICYNTASTTNAALTIAGSHRVSFIAPNVADVRGYGVLIGSDEGEIISRGNSIIGGSIERCYRECIFLTGQDNSFVGTTLLDPNTGGVSARHIYIKGQTVGSTSVQSRGNTFTGIKALVASSTVDSAVIFDGTGGGCTQNRVTDLIAVGITGRPTREVTGATGNITNGSHISADRGDASVTLQAGVDSPVQLFATALAANRTVTLSTTEAYPGARFRIVRTGLGAFTLAVGSGPLKTIPASTAAFVDVEYQETGGWKLTAYGAL